MGVGSKDGKSTYDIVVNASGLISLTQNSTTFGITTLDIFESTGQLTMTDQLREVTNCNCSSTSEQRIQFTCDDKGLGITNAGLVLYEFLKEENCHSTSATAFLLLALRYGKYACSVTWDLIDKPKN